jgi:hypothetical protein
VKKSSTAFRSSSQDTDSSSKVIILSLSLSLGIPIICSALEIVQSQEKAPVEQKAPFSHPHSTGYQLFSLCVISPKVGWNIQKYSL